MNELSIEKIIKDYLKKEKIKLIKILFTTCMLDYRGNNLLYLVLYDEDDINKLRKIVNPISDQSGINFIGKFSVIIQSISLSSFLKLIADYV